MNERVGRDTDIGAALLKISRNVSEFIKIVETVSTTKEIREALEKTRAQTGSSKTFAQIAIGDAISAFEDMVADIRRRKPGAGGDESVPVEIYHQLMVARDGKEQMITRDKARAALNDAVSRKLSSPVIQKQAVPEFSKIVRANDVRGPVLITLAAAWSDLVEDLSDLFRNEESRIVDKTADALKAAFELQFDFSAAAKDNNEDMKNNNNKKNKNKENIRMITIDDDLNPQEPQNVPVTRSFNEGGDQPARRGRRGGSNSLVPMVPGVEPELLKKYRAYGCEDITDRVLKKKDAPVVGRTADVKRIIEALQERESPHVLLHGEEGVGMSASVRALAEYLTAGEGVPKKLKDARVVCLNMATLIHTSGGGPMSPPPSDHLRELLEETAQHNRISPTRVILHIEDMGVDAEQSNPLFKQYVPIMRSVLAHIVKNNSANLSIVMETPEQQLELMRKSDSVILKTFTPVELKPLGKEYAVEAIKHHVKQLMDHHGVGVSDDVLEYVYKKTDQYMPNQKHPGKDFVVLGSMFAIAETNGRKEVTEDDAADVLSRHTGLPAEVIKGDISDRIAHLEENLRERIFGQDPALKRVADTIKLYNSGLHNPKNPLGRFMLLGPTGVGKTELARALAAILFGDENAVIRLDMSQLTEEHTVSRITGSPPGYIGYGDSNEVDKIEKSPFSILLLDEVEKAHKKVKGALLPILDDGILVKANGKKLNFRNAVVLMTSNTGAQAAEMVSKRGHLGFGEPSREEREATANQVRKDALSEDFPPEFRGRVTVINMDYLSPEVGRMVALKKIKEIGDRLRDKKRYEGVQIDVSDNALNQLMEVGYDYFLGARPMEAAVSEYVSEPLNLWIQENAEEISGRSAKIVVENIRDEANKSFKARVEPLPPPPAPPKKPAALPAPSL